MDVFTEQLAPMDKHHGGSHRDVPALILHADTRGVMNPPEKASTEPSLTARKASVLSGVQQTGTHRFPQATTHREGSQAAARPLAGEAALLGGCGAALALAPGTHGWRSMHDADARGALVAFGQEAVADGFGGRPAGFAGSAGGSARTCGWKPCPGGGGLLGRGGRCKGARGTKVSPRPVVLFSTQRPHHGIGGDVGNPEEKHPDAHTSLRGSLAGGSSEAPGFRDRSKRSFTKSQNHPVGRDL